MEIADLFNKEKANKIILKQLCHNETCKKWHTSISKINGMYKITDYHCPKCNLCFCSRNCMQKHYIIHKDDKPNIVVNNNLGKFFDNKRI